MSEMPDQTTSERVEKRWKSEETLSKLRELKNDTPLSKEGDIFHTLLLDIDLVKKALKAGESLDTSDEELEKIRKVVRIKYIRKRINDLLEAEADGLGMGGFVPMFYDIEGWMKNGGINWDELGNSLKQKIDELETRLRINETRETLKMLREGRWRNRLNIETGISAIKYAIIERKIITYKELDTSENELNSFIKNSPE